MAFKMKGSFLYGSPMKKNKPTYEEAWNNMKSYDNEMGNRELKKTKSGIVYSDDEKGYRQFVNDAELWNAKQKNKNLVKIERRKPKQTEIKMTPLAEPKTKTKTKKKFKDTKVGKFLSKKRTNQPRKKYNPRLNRFE